MKFKEVVTAAAIVSGFASGNASAQTNVTVYGQLDIGMQYLTHAGAGGSTLGLQSGNTVPSYWGIRGREDLGGGYAAIFRLESGFDLAKGALQSTLFNRYSYVGLDTPYGEVTVGNQYGVMFDQSVFYDPMYLAQYSLLSTGLIPLATQESPNSIKWIAPRSWGNITGEAMYAFGQEQAGHMAAGSYAGGALGYGLNGMSMRVAYEQARGTIGATDTSSLVDRRASIAAKVEIGKATLMAGYTNISGDLHLSPAGNFYYGGLTYLASPSVALAASVMHYQTHDHLGSPTWLVLNASYFLSKRTTLYAYAGVLSNHGGSSFTLNTYDPRQPGGVSQRGLQLGVNTKF